MILGPLYHWSPAARRGLILEQGLVPGKPHTVATTELDYICLGFSASGAWALSGATLHETIGTAGTAWDLWQVQLRDGDWVTIRGECGPTMREVTVATPLPPSRLWLAGTRVDTGQVNTSPAETRR